MKTPLSLLLLGLMSLGPVSAAAQQPSELRELPCPAREGRRAERTGIGARCHRADRGAKTDRAERPPVLTWKMSQAGAA